MNNLALNDGANVMVGHEWGAQARVQALQEDLPLITLELDSSSGTAVAGLDLAEALILTDVLLAYIEYYNDLGQEIELET